MNTLFQPTDTEKVWIADSGAEGPTVAVFGGVHGDEQTGIEIVKQMVEQGVNLEAGRVIVALGNLAAIGQNQRYTEDGVNLNRSFRELTPDEAQKDPKDLAYEVRRARELMTHMKGADALLDLHDFTNPKNPRFIITEQRGFAVAEQIGAPVISNGWSEAEPGGSDAFMESLQKIGLCYELGAKNQPELNLENGKGAVARFLISQGMFDGKLPPLYSELGRPRFILNERAFVRKSDGEYTLYIPEDMQTFESLEEGQKIAHLDGEDVYAEKNQVIIFPTKPEKTKVNDEAFSVGREFQPPIAA